MSLATINLLFVLSFAVPALYLALATRSRPARAAWPGFWLALAFAVPAIAGSLNAMTESRLLQLYLLIYAVVLGLPIVARLAMAATITRPVVQPAESVAVPPLEVIPDRVGGAVREGIRKGEICCEPKLVGQSGSLATREETGSSGTLWWIGSTYYEWSLSVRVVSVTDSGVIVSASAIGFCIPWFSVSARRFNESNIMTGTVFCRDAGGKCVARGSGGELQPGGGAFQIALSVDAVSGALPDEIMLEVDATASIEGKLSISKVTLGGTVGGTVGGVKLGGKAGTTINVINEAEAEVQLDGAYHYRCVPCEHGAMEGGGGLHGASGEDGDGDGEEGDCKSGDCGFDQKINIVIRDGPPNAKIDVTFTPVMDGDDGDPDTERVELDENGYCNQFIGVDTLYAPEGCETDFTYQMKCELEVFVLDADGKDVSIGEGEAACDPHLIIGCNGCRGEVSLDMNTEIETEPEDMDNVTVDLFVTLDEFKCSDPP